MVMVMLMLMLIRNGHADIFADAHQCRYPHYPTYVGYSTILSDNAEVDADIRIRMTIPNVDSAGDGDGVGDSDGDGDVANQKRKIILPPLSLSR